MAFENKPLREICEDEYTAVEIFGNKIAKSLKTRLSELRAAKSINDLINGYPSIIESNLNSIYKINIGDSYHLEFCANHVNNPLNKLGNIDWLKVRNVKILRLKNINE